MTSSEEGPVDWAPGIPAVTLVLEGVDPVILGVDPAQPTATELMDFCRAVVGALALEPEKARLVISGDFIRSVKSRLPDGPYRDAYGVERGAGTVAGKTLHVGPEVHVVMSAWLFADSAVGSEGAAEDAGELANAAAGRARLARRTVVHEAQHVAMDQASEDDPDFSALGWARRNFLTAAHQVIAEYRAELGVPNQLREESETDFPLASLDTLRSDLHRIAAVEYQQHRDVPRLSYDVVQQTLHAWKALAYVAAARRNASEPIGARFTAEVTQSDAWRLMVEDHWGDFERLLSPIPAGRTRVSGAELGGWTEGLADLLELWLATLGFTWRDDDHGGSEFLIRSWDLIE